MLLILIQKSNTFKSNLRKYIKFLTINYLNVKPKKPPHNKNIKLAGFVIEGVCHLQHIWRAEHPHKFRW
jgi:hypothetical protein